MNQKNPSNIVSLLAGGSAGFSADVFLFPLDTIKTRLQSEVGFRAAGGFRNLYSGIGPAALGSAPNAAAFFCTYEAIKKGLKQFVPERYVFCSHATAASFGEMVACILRVPTEVVKQRRQASSRSSVQIVKSCLKQEGFRGLFRGYWSTVAREIPFSFLQYPLWEFFKKSWSSKIGKKVDSWQSALCGSLAGGISAALTTPLDVAKTRIMLAKKGTKVAEGKILYALQHIYKENGFRRLYVGIVPRTIWMSVGGVIYFGVYEFTRNLLLEANFN